MINDVQLGKDWLLAGGEELHPQLIAFAQFLARRAAEHDHQQSFDTEGEHDHKTLEERDD